MRYKFFIALFIIVLFFSHITFAQEKPENNHYNNFLEVSEKYNIYNIKLDNLALNPDDTLKKIFDVIIYNIKDNFENIFEIFLAMISIIISFSLAETLITSDVIGKSVNYSVFIFCSLIICKIFEVVAETGINYIHNIREYMNVTFPLYVSVLSGSGFTSTAVAMRSIYIVFSNISVAVVDSFIVPALYLSAILAISSGISACGEVRKLSKTIIKISKFLIGILLIVFSTVLTFCGIVSSTSDGMLIKTAKLAISSFVPIVGNCISDTLNSVIGTSVLLKNMTGYIGAIIIILLIISPMIKFFLISILFKISSVFASFLTDEGMVDIFDICTSVISVFMSLLIFLSVMYILMFGTIIFIGG